MPDYKPVNLDSALYDDIWSAIDIARDAGIIAGNVKLYVSGGKVGFYSSLDDYDEILGERIEADKTDQDMPGDVRQKLDGIGRAVVRLYERAREVAPALKGLDKFQIDVIENSGYHYFLDTFYFDDDNYSLRLLGGGCIGMLEKFDPIDRKDRENFQKAFAIVLGALSVVRHVPSKCWYFKETVKNDNNFTMLYGEESNKRKNYALISTPVPGNDAKEAAYIGAVLTAGQSDKFPPGEIVAKDLLGKGYWVELVAVD